MIYPDVVGKLCACDMSCICCSTERHDLKYINNKAVVITTFLLIEVKRRKSTIVVSRAQIYPWPY